MSKVKAYILAFFLFVLLVLVRLFEEELFYDPYLLFFQNDYLYIDSPRREVAKLVLFTSLRYLINSVLSLGIIYCFFRDKNILKFSSLIYGIAYVCFLILFLYFVINPKQDEYYLFFNVRRFLIQPLILILLLPALYYYKLKR
ncbi:exosortase F system-associated membrane protein [Winogradskyella immobilis]|uniref:Exosortase F system-associated protein n=1 Tax=Winogradskyella immobilis TaxID=2816852 RepID=A0ABS8ELA5_9FLAO|nr:exosortase F system-associated protein [Winogradskyella immobilis]MCC1483991.1 exosortase F system-associated protein [Winogradskyella immobilis]MCG0016083.1 exosortase F system-associated protein [Winogradskyella immobilis]